MHSARRETGRMALDRTQKTLSRRTDCLLVMLNTVLCVLTERLQILHMLMTRASLGYVWATPWLHRDRYTEHMTEHRTHAPVHVHTYYIPSVACSA
jgi:hypothetical protein